MTAYPPARPPAGTSTPQDSTTGATPEDQAAIARYRYLLRTAPPERIEQVHAEAFARLTPQQRQAVLAEMTRTLPPEEVPLDEPHAMARAATRAEMAHPGYLQSTFGRAGTGFGGTGFGGMVAGSMLGTIAGVAVGSALAQALLGGFEQSPEAEQAAGGPDAGAGENGSGDETQAQADPGADPGTEGALDEHAWADEQAWGDVQADFGTDLDGFGGGSFF